MTLLDFIICFGSMFVGFAIGGLILYIKSRKEKK